MKTVKIFQLNKPNRNGVLYTKDSIKTLPTQLPVTVDFNENFVVGIAKNIRIEEDFIVGDIEENKKYSTISMMGTGELKGNEVIDFELLSLSYILEGTHPIEELSGNCEDKR